MDQKQAELMVEAHKKYQELNNQWRKMTNSRDNAKIAYERMESEARKCVGANVRRKVFVVNKTVITVEFSTEGPDKNIVHIDERE